MSYRELIEETDGIAFYLEQDSDPCNPRKEYDNVGKMVCWHRRYDLGDEMPRESPDEYLRNIAAELVGAHDPALIPDEHVQRILDKHTVMLSLYLYDHGGITMNTGGFYCPWDSGQVGFIYCTMEQVKSEWNGDIAAARKYLEGEVETYDQYLTGDVWGYVVESDELGVNESCWGFYGRGYAESEGRSVFDAIVKEHAESLEYAI